MKPIVRKVLGGICIFLCLMFILSFIAMKTAYPDNAANYLVGVLIWFCVFGYAAWRLLSPPKEKKQEDPHDDTSDVKVSFITSFLVYFVDFIIIILAAVLVSSIPIFLSEVLPQVSWLSSVSGILGIIAGGVVCVFLPGPKRFQKMINERKNKRS